MSVFDPLARDFTNTVADQAALAREYDKLADDIQHGKVPPDSHPCWQDKRWFNYFFYTAVRRLHKRAVENEEAATKFAAVLERQFNADGRLAPVLLDAAGDELLIATGPTHTEGLSTMQFPIHVSDFLGRIEMDRLAVEAKIS